MKSLLLMSVIWVSIALAAALARDRNPRRAVKRLLALMLIFNALYLAYVTMVHPFAYVPVWPW